MGQYVMASKDFRYDPTLDVRRGEVFKLRGCINDGGLLKHRLVTPVTLTAAEFKKLPRSHGRAFMETQRRDQSGQQDEEPVVARKQQRREKADQRRVLSVGM